jgi:hypothetical protein
VRSRRTDSFVEELLADRPTENLRPGASDTAVLRTAIVLRAGRPGADYPDDHFVRVLHQQLTGVVNRRDLPIAPPVLPPSPRRGVRHRRATVGAAAAALVVAIGVIAGTAGIQDRSPVPGVQKPAPADEVHSGGLVSADGRLLGRMYVYKGESSWVFMNVHSEGLAGVYTCELQLVNGTTVPVGNLVLQNGSGVFARVVSLDVSGVRTAKLVNATGATIASATFS